MVVGEQPAVGEVGEVSGDATAFFSTPLNRNTLKIAKRTRAREIEGKPLTPLIALTEYRSSCLHSDLV